MIVRKDKSYETNSMFLSVDWYNEGNLIIDETTTAGQQMMQTYIQNYPLVTFEHDGKIVTSVSVMELEKPPEIEGKEIQVSKNDLGDWEYIYIDIPKTEAEIQQDIINTLGQELALLKIQFMRGGI